MKIITRTMLALGLAVFLIACGGGGEQEVAVPVEAAPDPVSLTWDEANWDDVDWQ